jgi:hypothetical protein
MKFGIKQKITVFDLIFIVLFVLMLLMSLIFNDIKIIAVLIITFLVGANIRDYYKKKTKKI